MKKEKIFYLSGGNKEGANGVAVLQIARILSYVPSCHVIFKQDGLLKSRKEKYIYSRRRSLLQNDLVGAVASD
jgi:hypothetical protein